MLAEKPTSGLSLYVIAERELSRKYWVAGGGASGSTDPASGSYTSNSNRFCGLVLVPRPRIGFGVSFSISGNSWVGHHPAERFMARKSTSVVVEVQSCLQQRPKEGEKFF